MSALTGQSTMFRIQRESDGQFLAREGLFDWTPDPALAYQTNYPSHAAEVAAAAQAAADHAFFAAVVSA